MNTKKFIILLACISMLVSVSVIINTYAKYMTSTKGSANIPIARWNIKVNNSSIKENSNISNTIEPIFLGNENMASNIIAPTAEGYFDLNFDFSNTDVSFQYTISITPNANSIVKDLIATGYSIDNGEKILFENSQTEITEVINHSDNVKNRLVRIYVMWDDSSEATMDNEADTLATQNNGQALLDANISFTQVANQGGKNA